MFTVLIYRVGFGILHDFAVYRALTVLTVGVSLVVGTNLKFNLYGFICSLASTLIFVVQNIFSKKLFVEASFKKVTTEPRLSKLSFLFYSSISSFIFMIPLVLYYDSHKFRDGEMEITIWLIYLFFMNGITQFFQAILALSVLAMVSPITYSIASLCKRIFVITASIIYFRDSVSFVQGSGIIITFLGLYLYHKAELDVNQGEEKVLAIHRRNSSPSKV